MRQISSASILERGNEGMTVNHKEITQDGRSIDTPGQTFHWPITVEIHRLFEQLGVHMPLISGFPGFEDADQEKAAEVANVKKLPTFVCTGFSIGGTQKMPVFILIGGYYNSDKIFTQFNTPRKPLNADTDKTYRYTGDVREILEKLKIAIPKFMEGASSAAQQDIFAQPKITKAKIDDPKAKDKNAPVFKDKANGSPEGTTSGLKIPKADPEAMKSVAEMPNTPAPASSPADVAKKIVNEVNGGFKKVAQTPANPSGIKKA